MHRVCLDCFQKTLKFQDVPGRHTKRQGLHKTIWGQIRPFNCFAFSIFNQVIWNSDGIAKRLSRGHYRADELGKIMTVPSIRQRKYRPNHHNITPSHHKTMDVHSLYTNFLMLVDATHFVIPKPKAPCPWFTANRKPAHRDNQPTKRNG